MSLRYPLPYGNGIRFGNTSAGRISQSIEGLIPAQNERWRRGLGMQVEREVYFGKWTAAKGTVMQGYLPPTWDSRGKPQVIPDNVFGPKVYPSGEGARILLACW